MTCTRELTWCWARLAKRFFFLFSSFLPRAGVPPLARVSRSTDARRLRVGAGGSELPLARRRRRRRRLLVLPLRPPDAPCYVSERVTSLSLFSRSWSHRCNAVTHAAVDQHTRDGCFSQRERETFVPVRRRLPLLSGTHARLLHHQYVPRGVAFVVGRNGGNGRRSPGGKRGLRRRPSESESRESDGGNPRKGTKDIAVVKIMLRDPLRTSYARYLCASTLLRRSWGGRRSLRASSEQRCT